MRKIFVFCVMRTVTPYDSELLVYESPSKQEAESNIPIGWKVILSKEYQLK